MMWINDLNFLYCETGTTDDTDQELGQEGEDTLGDDVSTDSYDDEEVGEITQDELEDLIRAKEELDYLLSIPKIAEMVEKGDFGSDATSGSDQVQRQEVDPMKDPTGYLRSLIAEAVRNEVSGILRNELGGLQETLQPLLEENYEKQAIQEFNIVKNKYPTVKGVGLNSVLTTLSRHPTLSMEEAFLLNANKRQVVNKPPRLEKSSSGSASTGTISQEALAERARTLRERAVDIEKKGLNIRAIAQKFLRGEK